jgi:cell division protein FtsQ
MNDDYVINMIAIAMELTSGNYSGVSARKWCIKLFMLKILVGVLCVLLILNIILYSVLIPALSPIKVTYEGLRQYQSNDLRQIMGANANRTWFKFNTVDAVSALSLMSGIVVISVEKHFPDKVIIYVAERTPIAMMLTAENGCTKQTFLDKNGVVFSLPANIQQYDLPLISGLLVESYDTEMRVSKDYRILFEQLVKMTLLPQNYFAAISEIHVLSKNYNRYDLALYSVHTKQRILLDKGLNEIALQYTVVALDTIDSFALSISETDLRHGSVSYRTTK